MMRLSFIVMDRFETSSADEFRRKFAFLRECGYEGVELNMTESLLNNLDSLEVWLSESGLRMPSFLTGEAYAEGLCLSSPQISVRTASIERLRSCIDAAERFRSLFVVGMLQGTFQDEAETETAQQRITDGLRTVADIAERQNVKFVVEPVNHLQVSFNNSVTEVLDLIERVGSPAICPMVDTIHMNIEESSMLKSIADCGNRLAHVHLCESNGGQFGSGHIDFPGVLDTLNAIGYKGFGSVKVYRHIGFPDNARSSFEYLRDIQVAQLSGQFRE